MVRYAVMTFMYGPWANGEEGSHEELIRILADAGADGMEAFCNPFMGNDELLKLYQSGLKSAGIKMPVMDLIANLACKEKAAREEAYEAMRQGIDICDALDTEIVHLAGCRLVDDTAPEEGRKLIAEGLMDFVDDVEGRGMTLAFEDFDPSPTLICSADDCLDILKQTKGRVGFVFDTGNFEAVDEHAEDNFEKFIGSTCHFHFKDFAPNDDSTGYHGTHFGQGMVKNSEIAQSIRKANYDGWVALESYPQDGNGPRETVAKELAVLKAMF